MKSVTRSAWPATLHDPGGMREMFCRPENSQLQQRMTGRGETMVIDKGLGIHAFTDLIETAGGYMDCLKLGFGTAPLYPTDILLNKIELAKRSGVYIMPGGTLLEAAVKQNKVAAFFETVCRLGFNGIEVSDGTIELPRIQRSELIREGVRNGLRVVSEYGKKLSGSIIEADELAFTAEEDWNAGSELVTIEARESGKGVGLFDEDGECRDSVLEAVWRIIPDFSRIMWEAPLKHQQVLLLHKFGANVHLGNIPPGDTLTLETMRRGLRSDTFTLGKRQEEQLHYMI